jgi:hypothetical protein
MATGPRVDNREKKYTENLKRSFSPKPAGQY